MFSRNFRYFALQYNFLFFLIYTLDTYKKIIQIFFLDLRPAAGVVHTHQKIFTQRAGKTGLENRLQIKNFFRDGLHWKVNYLKISLSYHNELKMEKYCNK